MPESTHDKFFEQLEKDGLLVNEIASLGWAFWPKTTDGRVIGYFDENTLRILADEIERRNKPFWDEYEAHCRAQPVSTDDEEFASLGEFDVARIG